MNRSDAILDKDLQDKLKRFVYDVLGCCQLVHQQMGPALNEYMYQDALVIAFNKQNIPFEKEKHFKVTFLGEEILHEHKMDFFVKDKICLECKAVASLTDDHRQQLWNYMRLTKTRIGILYNFAPFMDQCEKYYFDPDRQIMYVF